MLVWMLFIYHVDTHALVERVSYPFPTESECKSAGEAEAQDGITYAVCRPSKP
jgi:hypothetical protein